MLNTSAKVIHSHARSPRRACETLDDFLNLRLLVDQNFEWAQKVIIIRVWMSVEHLSNDSDIADRLQLLLDCFLDRFARPFDVGATRAAHVVSSEEYEQLKASLMLQSFYGNVSRPSIKKVN